MSIGIAIGAGFALFILGYIAGAVIERRIWNARSIDEIVQARWNRAHIRSGWNRG